MWIFKATKYILSMNSVCIQFKGSWIQDLIIILEMVFICLKSINDHDIQDMFEENLINFCEGRINHRRQKMTSVTTAAIDIKKCIHRLAISYLTTHHTLSRTFLEPQMMMRYVNWKVDELPHKNTMFPSLYGLYSYQYFTCHPGMLQWRILPSSCLHWCHP